MRRARAIAPPLRGNRSKPAVKKDLADSQNFISESWESSSLQLSHQTIFYNGWTGAESGRAASEKRKEREEEDNERVCSVEVSLRGRKRVVRWTIDSCRLYRSNSQLHALIERGKNRDSRRGEGKEHEASMEELRVTRENERCLLNLRAYKSV